MAKLAIDEFSLYVIAEAIREKEHSTGLVPLAEMGTRILQARDYDIEAQLISKTLAGAYKNPALVEIPMETFMEMRGLTAVDFPAVRTVGASAFLNCTGLVWVDIPAAEVVEAYAFRGCTGLQQLTLASAQRINANAFNGSGLSQLILTREDGICTLGAASAFTGTPIAAGKGEILVPAHLRDAYKSASGWSTYANQIMPL